MPKTKTSFKEGHIVTETTKQKISKRLIGNKNFANKKHTEESKRKMSEYRFANPRITSSETKNNISNSLKGRKLSIETRKRIGRRGENNPAWKGGASQKNKTERQILMRTVEYRLWREAVFERDNWTCVWGDKEHGTKLNADHIKPWKDYPALRFAIDNGRTLCVGCHKKTDTYGNRKRINL